MKGKILLAVLIGVISTFSAFGQNGLWAGVGSNPFNVNLLKNGNAEAADSAPWTNGAKLEIFRYDGGWGDPWLVMPSDHADNYFYASVSKDAPDLSFSQKIDVSKIAQNIDTGKLKYKFGGWFGVIGDASGRLKVTFYGEKEAVIKPTRADGDATEEITAANRPADQTMVEKIREGYIPVGTRKISVTLAFSLFNNRTTNEGTVAVADSLSFMLVKEK